MRLQCGYARSSCEDGTLAPHWSRWCENYSLMDWGTQPTPFLERRRDTAIGSQSIYRPVPLASWPNLPWLVTIAQA